jgi:hypothetical protein
VDELLRVTLDGKYAGPYVVEAMCDDGRLVVRPEQSAERTVGDAGGTRRLTSAEFDARYSKRPAHDKR